MIPAPAIQTGRDAAFGTRRSPASAGTRIGPSESASVMTGWCAAMLKRPTWIAEPAPSMTLLVHPQSTASITGTAAMMCLGTRSQNRPEPMASAATAAP